MEESWWIKHHFAGESVTYFVVVSDYVALLQTNQNPHDLYNTYCQCGHWISSSGLL